MPFPCRADKGLDCVFPIWFTECGRVWFTRAMPHLCHATTMPFWKWLLKAMAQHGMGMAWHRMCELAFNATLDKTYWLYPIQYGTQQWPPSDNTFLWQLHHPGLVSLKCCLCLWSSEQSGSKTSKCVSELTKENVPMLFSSSRHSHSLFSLYRVIKKSLCTWWLQYKKQAKIF
jgi:hypothetical protein